MRTRTEAVVGAIERVTAAGVLHGVPLYDSLDSLELVEVYQLLEAEYGWRVPEEIELSALASVDTLAAELVAVP